MPIPLFSSRSFSPMSIPGLSGPDTIDLWLDASQIVGLNNADPVITWNDSSTQANHVTQGTAAKRPTFRTNQINGHPVVRFDGTDDLLVRTTPARFTSLAGSIFMVFRKNVGGAAFQDGLSFGNAATDTRNVIARIIVSGTNRFAITQNNGGTADTENSTTTIGTTVFQLCEFSSSGTAYNLRYNGTPETLILTSGSNTGDWYGDTTSMDHLSVGAAKRTAEANFFSGDFAEIVVVNVDITAAQRSAFHTYFRGKYGFAIAL